EADQRNGLDHDQRIRPGAVLDARCRPGGPIDARRAGAVERRHDRGAGEADVLAAQLPGEHQGHRNTERDDADADAGGLSAMDALIYTLMSGAERSLRAQQVHANNLANADTGGFRADLELARSETVTQGYGYDARHMSRLEANALSTRQGALRETGRELDVAVVGQGYFAVQTSGGEAYTRAGAFVIDADGALTLHGRAVLGDGGPIVLPEHVKLQIGADGLISILPPGERDMQPVDRLKLVNPAADELTKNAEG